MSPDALVLLGQTSSPGGVLVQTEKNKTNEIRHCANAKNKITIIPPPQPHPHPTSPITTTTPPDTPPLIPLL